MPWPPSLGVKVIIAIRKPLHECREKFLCWKHGRARTLDGIVYGCLAAICYGTNPLGALHLYAEGLTPESVLFYRFAFAVVFLALTMLVSRISFRVRLKELPVLALLGILFAVSSLTYYTSFHYMDAGLASTLLFLYPLEVALIMVLFFRERLSVNTVISIAVSLIGIALLYHGAPGATLDMVGLLLVFVSSLTYAVYIVVVNHADLQMGSVKLTFYAMLFCLLCLPLYAQLGGSGLPPMLSTPAQWGWGMMLGLVPAYLSLVFMAKAVKLVGSTPTAITGALEPLTAVFIGTLFFGEALTGRLVAGIVLILFAVLLVAVKKR